MRKLIKVKQKHINDGNANCPFSCPVALAVCDTLGILLTQNNSTTVGVSKDEFRITKYSYGFAEYPYVHYRVPKSIKRFISKFDRGNEVKPFNFYLIEELP